jgi:hypothetical protein
MLHFLLSGILCPLLPLTGPSEELRSAMSTLRDVMMYFNELVCQLVFQYLAELAYLDSPDQLGHDGNSPVSSFHQSLRNLTSASHRAFSLP